MKKQWLDNVIKYLFLAVFCFPILKDNYTSKVVIALCLVCMLYFLIRRIKPIFDVRFVYLTIPFFIFIFHPLFVENSDLTVKIIQRNLLFVVLPILFGFLPKDIISQNVINRGVTVFKNACLVLICYYLYFFLASNSINDLFKFGVSYQPIFRTAVYEIPLNSIHPTYSSIFFIFAIAISVLDFNRGKKYNIYLIPIFCLFVILLSSKIAYLLLILTILFLTYKLLKISNKKKSLILFLITMGFSFLIYFTPSAKIRFTEIIKEYNRPLIGLYTTSTNIRLAILKCSINLASENYLAGLGFDNAQNELNTCYQLNYDSDFSLDINYNTHNYFLYILIGSGVIGLLFFLYSLGYIIQLAIKSKNLLFIILLLNVLIVCFVENFLYRVQGLLFFYWFLCVFVLKSNNDS